MLLYYSHVMVIVLSVAIQLNFCPWICIFIITNYFCLLSPCCMKLFCFQVHFQLVQCTVILKQVCLQLIERPSPGSQLLVLLAMCSRASNLWLLMSLLSCKFISSFSDFQIWSVKFCLSNRFQSVKKCLGRICVLMRSNYLTRWWSN